MAVPETIVELIERFDRNRAAYKSDQYNEARLRIELTIFLIMRSTEKQKKDKRS